MGQDEWDKVEKKLEDGDDPELLVSEDKIAMDDYDRRRGQGLQPPEEEVALKCAFPRGARAPLFSPAAFPSPTPSLSPPPPPPPSSPLPAAGRATSGCATRRPCPAPR